MGANRYFSTPVYYVDQSLPVDDPAAYKTAIMMLNLKTGAHNIEDVEPTSVLLFSSVISPIDRNTAFAAYTQLSRFDLSGKGLTGRVDLDHTYYAVNISSDGEEIYVGGAACYIGVYDSGTLSKKTRILFLATVAIRPWRCSA